MQGETIIRAGGRRSAPIDLTVSEQARERAFQRARRHSLFVKFLKAVLPVVAIGCLGYYGLVLAASSALTGSGVSVGKVTVDPTNLLMADPRYSGFGKDGSEYKVHAESAVTDLRMSAPIKLNVIDGQIAQPNGVVTALKAKWGTYDQKKELLELYEKIDVDANNGMIARLTRATVFTKESRITSDQPIYAETSTGKIRANAMSLNTKARTAAFRDAVTVTLKPTRPAAAKDGNAPAKTRSTQAFGIDTSSNEPVVVTSRRLDVDDNAHTALFREDVVARQGEASLAAPELDVLYEGRANLGTAGAPAAKTSPGDSEASKLKALRARGGVTMANKGDRADSQTLDYDAALEQILLSGDVVMTQAPDRRVTAQTVLLKQKEDTALLTGAVVVTQGRNVLRGESLAIDRKVGTAKLSSPAAGGEPAGRVFTLLYQNQTDKPNAKTKAKGQTDEQAPAVLGALGANFKSDPNAPIDVEARTLDVNDRKHIAIYTGAVVAKQGTFVVKTEEMTAHYQGNMGLLGGEQPDATAPAPGAKSTGSGPGGSQLKRIEARHGVVVTGAEGQQATGEWADFDVALNTIVMGGNVMVSQGKQIVRAPAGMRLVIDLGTGVTRFEPEPGASAKAGPQVSGAFATSVAPVMPGMPGCPPGAVCKSGRLEAIFYPNQFKEKSGKGAGGAAAKAGREGKAPETGSAWTSTTKSSGTP